MAESDYLKYLQNPGGTADPYATNPFSEGAPADETGLTPFAGEDVAPFRFTQTALNPSTQATGGYAGRAQVARSPFTSGQEYQSLRGIRSELAALGDVQNPGEAPIMPQELAPMQEQQQQPQPQQEQVATGPTGLPTMNLYLPESTVLGGMNPLFAARMFMAKNEGKDQSALEKEYGPVREMQAYDMKSMLGDEEYNMWFGKDASYQGGENQATQRFMTNLSILPTSVDPFSSLTMQKQLASRDFAYAPTGQLSTDDLRKAITMGSPLPTVEQGGEEIIGYKSEGEGEHSPIYGPTNVAGSYDLSFDPNDPNRLGNWNEDTFQASLEKDLNNPIHNSTKTIRYAKKATRAGAFALIGAAAGAGLGAAAGALAGGTGAAAGGAGGATGLAGGLGMSAGTAATTVNTLSSMVATYGASKAAELIGLPMDSPWMIMAMSAAGSAAGYTPGGPGGTGVPTETLEVGVGGNRNMIPTYMTNATPELSAAYNQAWASGANTFQLPIAGSVGSDLTPEQQSALTKYGVKTGLGFAQEQLTPGPGSGGEALQGPSGYDQQMDQYNQQMSQYNTDLGAYNTAVAEWQRKQELAQLYEQKMAEYEAKVGLYSNAQGLRGKQASMMSNIQGNLAENPFYDTPENYTGIQTMFV